MGAKNKKIPVPPKEELAQLYLDDKQTLKEIAVTFNTVQSTVSGWLRQYEIPTRVLRVEIRNGKKQCTLCRQWLLIGNYSRGNIRGYRSGCKTCLSRSRRVLFTDQYKAWVRSITARVGIAESCRRIGIHEKTHLQWRKDPPATIRRENAKAIVKVMAELRANDEIRHKLSIKRGAALRGEKERTPLKNRDLYFRGHDQKAADEKRRKRLTRAAESASVQNSRTGEHS